MKTGIVMIAAFSVLIVCLELTHGPFFFNPTNQRRQLGTVYETRLEHKEDGGGRYSDQRIGFGQSDGGGLGVGQENKIKEKSALEIPERRQLEREGALLPDGDVGLTTGTGRYGKPVYGNVMNQIVIYNALPKCGSGTLTKTMIEKFYLQRIPMGVYKMDGNGGTNTAKRINIGDGSMFQAYKESNNNNKLCTKINEPAPDLPTILHGEKPPLWIHGHFLLPEVRDEMKPAPVFINMIRDPLERFRSAFYWRQTGDSIRGTTRETTQLESFDTCIRRGLMACSKDHSYAYKRLCGMHARCGTDSQWAVQRAKENVDRLYTFIGITEEYETSLRIFEHLVPDVFRGVVDRYNSENAVNFTDLTATITKKEISPDMVEMGRRQLKEEYELYNYIYGKFQRMKQRYGLQ